MTGFAFDARLLWKIHSRKKSQRKNIYMYISIVMNLTKLMLLKVALNIITPIHLTKLTWWSESRGWCWSCYNGEKNHNYNFKQFETMPISYDVRVFNNNTTGVTSGVGTSDPSEASPVFSAVHVVQSLVYLCSVLQISLCSLVVIVLNIKLSVLWFLASDKPFSILKLFLFIYIARVFWLHANITLFPSLTCSIHTVPYYITIFYPIA